MIAVCLAAAVSGCGPGAGPSSANVAVAVTRDFGTRPVARVMATRVPGSETVIELLERHLHVASRYGNDYVESIDGFSGTSAHLDWFYYVNGTEAAAGAGTTAVHRGDRIWWDLHDWAVTDSIPAVVGSYPEPFVAGARHRTPLSCAPDVTAACTVVAHALARAGISVQRRGLAGGKSDARAGPAIVVGTGQDLGGVPAARLIASGPQASGVYARFGAGDRTLQLLNPRGTTTTTLGPGAGLLAATAVGGSGAATWVITGTDRAGVAAAANALAPARLRNVFALAIGSDGRSLPVPLDPSF